MPTAQSMSVIDVLATLGTPNAPLLIDICVKADHAADPYVIPGAIRHSHDDIAGLISRLNGRPAVIVCQKGRKLSQGVSAWLRSDGIEASYLIGGMYGWRDCPETTCIPTAALPIYNADLWVTANAPNTQSLAALWLIHRFIQRDARVLFVERSEVAAVAGRFKAASLERFMTPDARASGVRGFAQMLKHFHLKLPVLQELASHVSVDAKTDITAGFHVILEGCIDQGADDHDRMRAAFPIFDALLQALRAQTKILATA